MHALIVQHEEASPPGMVREWLESRGARLDVLRIDVEDRRVDARDYGLIVSLGSEFAAFDESLAFLQPEMDLFRDALRDDVPILGICFGGQLLARVLGGEGFRATEAEIGWVPVRSRDTELVPEGPWFEWHFDSFTLPSEVELIAETDVGPQAFLSGRNMGVQFHPEVTPQMMDDWVRVYRHELEAEGVDADDLLAETNRLAARTRERSWQLLDRFLDRIAAQPSEAR